MFSVALVCLFVCLSVSLAACLSVSLRSGGRLYVCNITQIVMTRL